MQIAIYGVGYVGLTTATALAYLGHAVVCIDADVERVEALRRGEPTLYEPGLAELLAASRARMTFLATSDEMPVADVVFIAVGTPPAPDGSPDLRHVRAAAKQIGRSLGERLTVVVNKSTVPVGSGNWVASVIEDELALDAPTSKSFAVASNPEFLREGTALHDSFYPDRIVVGSDDARALQVLEALYEPVLRQSFEPPPGLPRPVGMTSVPLVTTSLPSAELIKYSANAFLAVKVSFINEIAEMAERIGADVVEVARGIGLDARIGPRFLQAGIGWGGSCFGKDTSALVSMAHEYGIPMSIVEAARSANSRQRDRVVDRLLQHVKLLAGRTIGLLGLAFKPDTDDLRDAPALDLARRLRKFGARVKVHDPVAMDRARREHPELDLVYCESATDVAHDASALVLVTEWAEYAALDWKPIGLHMRGPRLVLDARNALDGAAVAAAGLTYLPIGRSAEDAIRALSR